MCAQAEDWRSDWEYEVANGDTQLGFDEWCEHRRELEADGMWSTHDHD